VRRSFSATILEGRGGGAYAEVPFDVEAVFGDKRPPVNATIDGVPFQTRLVRMGSPCHVVGVPKEIRVQLGKGVGDTVKITLEPDATPRVVEVPPDLAQVLKKSPKAKEFFEGLSYTHRKEYVRWITEAKKEETRLRRLDKTVEMLLAGQRGI
jgi:bifunctional DNA-binding transcriptional regulator/antitoxin component of YhaV-PrlF toxin-antitoxin module